MQFTINERGGKADREDQEGEQTGAGGGARNGRTTRTWFSIPSAGEPALVADQQLVLYRRRIGLLECPSVVHPDDGDERRRGTGSMCCERLCEGLGLRLYWTKGSRCGERAADGGRGAILCWREEWSSVGSKPWKPQRYFTDPPEVRENRVPKSRFGNGSSKRSTLSTPALSRSNPPTAHKGLPAQLKLNEGPEMDAKAKELARYLVEKIQEYEWPRIVFTSQV